METPHEYQYCNLVLFAHYLELVITTFYFYFSSDYINYISALLYVAIFKVCIPLFVIKGEITIFSLFIPFFSILFMCLWACMYVCVDVCACACVCRCQKLKSGVFLYCFPAYLCVWHMYVCCVWHVVCVLASADVFRVWRVYNFIIFLFYFYFSFQLRFVCDLQLVSPLLFFLGP